MQKGGTSGREQDNTRESLLYFEGPVEVQGLFEYLFNESRRFCGEDCDVPLLMAPVAFPSACLKQLRPKVSFSLDCWVKTNIHQCEGNTLVAKLGAAVVHCGLEWIGRANRAGMYD